jgi:hypothetical protein
VVSFTFMKDDATMKAVDDPKSRSSDNAIKRCMRLRGLSSAVGKPKAFAAAQKYRARTDIARDSFRVAVTTDDLRGEGHRFLDDNVQQPLEMVDIDALPRTAAEISDGKEEMKEERKERRKEGRKEGRKEEGRKEGRKEERTGAIHSEPGQAR